MNFLISISHPAWSHQFKAVIELLKADKQTVIVAGINKDGALDLLDSFGIPYHIIATHTGKNTWQKIGLLFSTTFEIFKLSRKYKPDFYIGRAAPMVSVNAFLFRKKHLVFEDTEISRIGLLSCQLFSTEIITPNSFMRNLGKKHLRINGLKELFYLHPNRFQPNSDIFKYLKIEPTQPFVFIRLVAFAASHDLGYSGTSVQEVEQLIERCKKIGKVFVSSELELPTHLKEYQINVPFDQIHHVLYFAQLVLTEGATMATESAILRTPSIYLNPLNAGTINSLANDYNLIIKANSGNKYQKAMQAIDTFEHAKDSSIFKENHAKLIADNQDMTTFYMNRINHYLES